MKLSIEEIYDTRTDVNLLVNQVDAIIYNAEEIRKRLIHVSRWLDDYQINLQR